MKSIIAWFTRNTVAANLLLVAIVGVGAYQLRNIPLEGFPDIQIDRISISMAYRGATPEEVEKTIILRIEESIQGLEGIEEITSTAREGSGSVSVEVSNGYDAREVLDDIKNRVDSINTFPPETENPRFSVSQRIREAIGVAVYGEASEATLRNLAERVRDELANLPSVTQADVTSIRPFEIAIEVPEKILRAHGLSLQDVAGAISNSSLDLPAGSLKTEAGEVLLRTRAQAYRGDDFSDIILMSRTDGSRLRLSEVADIHDSFEETPLYATFNGKPAVFVSVRRVGDQSIIQISKEVRDYIATSGDRMPPGTFLGVTSDGSVSIYSRLKTLQRSAIVGLILVALLLAVFLRLAVAVWVCVGIPVCMMGALAVMPFMGITLNLISVFAFILVLGIVVDDAIVVGENVYARMRRGEDPEQAAILGTQEVAVPVTFGVLTTMAAFLPLAMVPGFRGEIFKQIPAIVIPVLFFSILESKFILPAHLRHMKPLRAKEHLGPILRLQAAVANGLETFVERVYTPFLERCLSWRYLTLAGFVVLMLLSVGLFRGGTVRFIFFPKVERETVTGSLTMPLGTPSQITEDHVRHMLAGVEALQEKYNRDGVDVIGDISMMVGSTMGRSGASAGQSHVGAVRFEVMDPELREQNNIQLTSGEVISQWRKLIGRIPGAEDVNLRAEFGGGGDPVEVQLRGREVDQLRRIAVKLREKLNTFPGLFDVSDSFTAGKQEVTLKLRPEGEFLGLTNSDLARQVRYAFYGFEAQRIQRGRDDVRVMVRLPRTEREQLSTLENLLVQTRNNTRVPLNTVADISYGRGFSTIERVDRQRVVTVSADADLANTDIEGITVEITKYLDELLTAEAGVNYRLEGQERERRESFVVILYGLMLVLFAIYAMLAIPFRSYVQPLIVMSVIPFGFVGALAGHWLMGKNLSIMSFFGMLALVGVVVNDSLVLVDYVNRSRKAGEPLALAVRRAGGRRFRPILLTSLTTFFGLMPMILEKATQAQFLIPMAISLGFGILFTTFVTLLLVPANYLILEDILNIFRWVYGRKVVPVGEATSRDDLQP